MNSHQKLTTQLKTLFRWLRVLTHGPKLGVMNIELAPEVQLRMKHPVSGLNEIALVPFREEKESLFYRQSLPAPVAPN